MDKDKIEEIEIEREQGQQSQQALLTAGQRKINIIWEITQATIAIITTVAAIFVAASLSLKGDKDAVAFLLLSNAFFVIIGFYFGRTNHQRTGGVGYKDINQGR